MSCQDFSNHQMNFPGFYPASLMRETVAQPNGFAGNMSPGYPGAMPSGYPGTMPSGYPGAMPSGYPGATPSGYPGTMPSGLPETIPSGPTYPLPMGTTQQPGVGAVEESFIENILRFNKGKIGTFYFTYQGNNKWNSMVYYGRVETAGRDHIIISDPSSGKRYLLLMANLDWVEFEEEINYPYPSIAPGVQATLTTTG